MGSKNSHDTQFLEIFTLKLCEGPNYLVALNKKSDEQGGVEVQVAFNFDRSMDGSQMSLDMSELKHEFPHGVTISEMTTPVWITPIKGYVSLTCSAPPEKKVKDKIPPELVSHTHRAMYESLREHAGLPLWNDLSISKQKLMKHQIDMLLLIAKM